MSQKYMEKRVKEHFTDSDVYNYRNRKGFVHSEDQTILNFIKNTCTSNSQLLEVGGGSGYMLDLIYSETPIKYFYNCEIVPLVYKTQVNKEINLIGSNALNLPFKNGTFDYVIIKNVLHHLVGRTRGESKENSRRAIIEITRIIKKNGYIIVLEQYNKYNLFASIVFYSTLFFSLFGLGFKSFGWGKNVIVSFLTPNEIKTSAMRANIELIVYYAYKSIVPKKLKISLLMADIGRVLLIGRVRKHE